MIVLLMVVTIFLTLGLLLVLLSFLKTIVGGLEGVGGGRNSALGDINASVIGIRGHTSFIAPEVTKLNRGLHDAANGLRAIDGGLVAVANAAVAQERYR